MYIKFTEVSCVSVISDGRFRDSAECHEFQIPTTKLLTTNVRFYFVRRCIGLSRTNEATSINFQSTGESAYVI